MTFLRSAGFIYKQIMKKNKSQKAKILIVDDIAPAGNVVHKKMTDEGYECVEAKDNNEALALLAGQHFELILLDIMTKGKGGREILPEIVEKYPDTAVIMAASPDDTELAIEAMKIGAYDYVIKPVQLNELPVRVWKALERRNLRIKNREYELSLEKRVEAQTQQIRKAFQNSIKSLAYALEARDEYTGGHSQRVSQYARLIADRLGATRKQIEKIEQAALVHDIGKIGIRESVLMKTTELTEEEYQHIAAHSVIGEHILRPAIDDEDILKMVRHHHERFDGKGYPDGLSNIQIPHGARILAVADMYDAMTSDRPYRDAVSPGAAVTELKKQTGYMFDPVVVNAFFRILSSEYEYTTRRPIISFNLLNIR